MRSKNNNPKGRESELVVQEVKDEVLIYDLQANKAYVLNPTSAMIWNLCDGSNSVSEISKQISMKMKQPVNNDLIWLALDQFKKDNLLADSADMVIEFNGLSRREAIRKAGVASMVALPVILSLVAPTAAMAQSVAALSANCQTCTANADCASGRCLRNASGGSNLCAVNTDSSTYPLGTGFGAGDAQCPQVVGPSFCCSGQASKASGVCRCE